MTDLWEIGALIASRRKALKLTQKALADRARVGRTTLDALENGRAGELGFTKVARILTALGIGLRIVEAPGRRPTLEDLRNDDDD
ncbi:MAG: helix-turn-helix domain-containing protein [Brevundimonas sp.]